MTKSSLEITLTKEANAFALLPKLRQIKGIRKAYAVTCSTLRIYFDADTIADKVLVKRVGTMNKKNGKRSANVIGIKEAPPETPTAA